MIEINCTIGAAFSRLQPNFNLRIVTMEQPNRALMSPSFKSYFKVQGYQFANRHKCKNKEQAYSRNAESEWASFWVFRLKKDILTIGIITNHCLTKQPSRNNALMSQQHLEANEELASSNSSYKVKLYLNLNDDEELTD
jgi:hypothetical protein